MLEQIIQPSLIDARPAKRILWLIVLVFIFGSLFSLLGMLLSMLIFNMSADDFMNLMDHLDKPEIAAVLKFNQLMSAIGVFIAPAIYFAYMTGKTPAYAFNLKSFGKPLPLFISMICILMFVPSVSFLHELNQKMVLPSFLSGFEAYLKDKEILAEKLTHVFLQMNGTLDVIYTLIIIAVIPAIGEELIFRGILQPEINRITKNGHLAVWITAAVFSFIHFQFYGFLPRLFLGAILGYIFLYSNNLWLPIFGHFSNNAFGVIWFYYESKGVFPKESEAGFTDSWQGLIILLSATLIAFFCLFYIKREHRDQRLYSG
jgi:membrane protease YdiL (CAAX protease family)